MFPNENFKIIAKCFQEFEDELAEELLQLGAREIKKGRRNVSFVGDMGFLYKANLCLRTALRLIVPIASFGGRNLDTLYMHCREIPWETYFRVGDSIAIDPTVNSTLFTHSLVVAQKTKDAIADRFREKVGKRPNVDLENPDIRINVHIDEAKITLSLDSSGESLHKRGYKTATNIAPINEVLAAGLVMKSGWKGQSDFLDPMCGSGTILVEAAMIAMGLPANGKRKSFAFRHWRNYDEELFQVILESSYKKKKSFTHKIIGYDKAPSAVVKAMANVRNAEVSEWVEVTDKDFFRSFKEGDKPLHILFNPPYGERLTIDVPVFYQKIGDTLKQNYPGAHAWFITSNMEGLKYVGLKPKGKTSLFNGSLEAKFVHYELYEGSKKQKSKDRKEFRPTDKKEFKRQDRRENRREDKREPRRDQRKEDRQRDHRRRDDRKESGFKERNERKTPERGDRREGRNRRNEW